MKLGKKILASLALVGMLSIGAGIGTYAAFTASVKSEANRIDVATYTINNMVGEQRFPLFTLTDAIPGSVTDLNGLVARVTGNRTMKLTPNLQLIINKRVISNNELTSTAMQVDLSKDEGDAAKYFEINTKVTSGNTTVFDSNNQFVPIKNFMDAINSAGIQELATNGAFTILSGKVRINDFAGNDYQGATVEATLTLTAENLGKAEPN